MNFKRVCVFATMAFAWAGLSGCSSAYKQRQVEKERVSQSSGHYCEFVNGDDHNDIDVELNLQMAKKCDLNKNYNFTSYKNASDIFGIVYCCATKAKQAVVSPSKTVSPNTANTTNTKDKDKDKKASEEVDAE